MAKNKLYWEKEKKRGEKEGKKREKEKRKKEEKKKKEKKKRKGKKRVGEANRNQEAKKKKKKTTGEYLLILYTLSPLTSPGTCPSSWSSGGGACCADFQV